MLQRVSVTPEAMALIAVLREQHGPLLFHQSGGCCDGSAPMCYAQNEFLVGDADVFLGEIAECPFYMTRSQFEYWRHTQLIIDAKPGRAAAFSLEGSSGKRFVTVSRVFTDEELEQLPPIE